MPHRRFQKIDRQRSARTGDLNTQRVSAASRVPRNALAASCDADAPLCLGGPIVPFRLTPSVCRTVDGDSLGVFTGHPVNGRPHAGEGRRGDHAPDAGEGTSMAPRGAHARRRASVSFGEVARAVRRFAPLRPSCPSGRWRGRFPATTSRHSAAHPLQPARLQMARAGRAAFFLGLGGFERGDVDFGSTVARMRGLNE
jgi:hypothetical protein